MLMKPEKVLVLLLVISLCGNIYLIFFNQSGLDQYLPGMNISGGIPDLNFSNSSGQNNFKN
jgi:hypothetical protein